MTPAITTATAASSDALAALHSLAIWSDASDRYKTALENDLAWNLEQGLSIDEILTALEEWGNDAAGYLRDAGSLPTELEEKFVTVYTAADYARRLARFELLVVRSAESNYALSLSAFDAVLVHLGSAPGSARRSTAISALAQRLVDADPDNLYPPPGKEGDEHLRDCHRDAVRRVNKLVHGGAMLRLLFGATVKNPVVCVDGICRPKSSKANPSLAWNRIRELMPLAKRLQQSDEYSETWALLPGVEEDCRALVRDVLNDKLLSADIQHRVRLLCLESATKRLANGDRAAADDVRRWGGRIERSRAEATEEATQPATPLPVKPIDTEKPARTERVATAQQAEGGEEEAEKLAAEMLELVREFTEPDDLLVHLLRGFEQSGLLCKSSQRAVQAALIILSRTSS